MVKEGTFWPDLWRFEVVLLIPWVTTNRCHQPPFVAFRLAVLPYGRLVFVTILHKAGHISVREAEAPYV